ncbi:hypothetical protein DA2_2711 [Desulfovibrio sp. A2]|nr:hypothetical protein DA2_2711 [Desulfovibrio sp. A2]
MRHAHLLAEGDRGRKRRAARRTADDHENGRTDEAAAPQPLLRTAPTALQPSGPSAVHTVTARRSPC